MYGYRSLLFVPGHVEKFYAGALASDADIIVLDVEDSVPPDCKNQALAMIEKGLRSYTQPNRLMVRPSSSLPRSLESELAVAVRCGVKRVLVPKVESISQLETARDKYIEVGGDKDHLELFALIETARGIDQLNGICEGSVVNGLVFGHEDYMASIDGNDDGNSYILEHARSMIINKARSNGLVAIDSPYLSIGNTSGLKAYARKSRRNGFDGMLVIHPSQISEANSEYKGSAEEVERALGIVDAYDNARAEGRNIVYVNGRFVAPPIVKAAKRLLSRWNFYKGVS